MSMNTISQTFEGVAYEHRQCWCGISFAIPKTLRDYYVRTNEANPQSFSIYCPLGHGMVPTRSRTESDRLRDELAREKHRTEQATAEAKLQTQRANEAWGRVMVKDRQIAARKGQITKMRKRVERGVCPCCDRYFANLHQHMQGEHPEWEPENELDLTPPLDIAKSYRKAWKMGARSLPDAVNPFDPETPPSKYHARAWERGRDAAHRVKP